MGRTSKVFDSDYGWLYATGCVIVIGMVGVFASMGSMVRRLNAQVEAAYQDGREAAQMGFEPEANPYKIESMSEAWYRGYVYERKHMAATGEKKILSESGVTDDAR